MAHETIETAHVEKMNAVAQLLDEVFKGYGFCLLVFSQGGEEGRMNYIGNSLRDDMVIAMKEFIANHEGSFAEAPNKIQ